MGISKIAKFGCKILQSLENIDSFLLIITGEPDCRHVIIVDDLIKTGGTILECAKVRAYENFSNLSFVTKFGMD
jgi:predicted amidophosphoribosyltransferase